MSRSPTSIKELCEFIWYLEEKYGLLDFEIDGVKVWQYTRMQIYYILAEKSSIFAQPHSKLTKIDKLKFVLGYMKNSFKDNFFTLKQVDVLVSSHPRVVRVDGEGIDIYTKYFIDEIKAENRVIDLESPYLGEHKKTKQYYTHYTDWIRLAQLIQKVFLKVNLSKKELDTLGRVQQEIMTVCNVNLDLIRMMISRVKDFKVIYRIYDSIFKKVQPKSFYIVVAYLHAPIIKAAKDNGVNVIELQHGVFSKYHLGYSFPNRIQPLEYFPDQVFVWNYFWKEIAVLPLEAENVIVDRFRYLEKSKSKYSNIKQDDNKVLVISQGAIGNKIAEYLLECFDQFKEKKIIYKLHPGEFDRWQSYSALVELNKYENVTVVKDEIPLYELFSGCKIQVGVFSTALYEGVEFGCRTVLLNISGIEYMDNFIKLRDDVEVI